MDPAIGNGFDFDQWSELARHDPAEFDRRRLAAIDEVMTGALARRSLRGLQWRIDAERRLARTPLNACIRLSAMMWESFLALEHALDGSPASPVSSPPSNRAVILEFRRP